jgi:superfamily II DNA or RNA helicase
MKITPRDYQLECVADIRSSFRRGDQVALVQLPTGSGKTCTAATFINQILDLKADYRVLILVPKVKILREFLEVLPPELTTIASHSWGKIDVTGQIVVGTFQTLATRDLPVVDLVICDECHLLNDKDKKSQYYATVNRAIALNPDVKILGLTATPFRDTGLIYGAGRFFPEPVFKRDLLWTTDQGFTVKARVYQPSEAFDLSSLTIDNTGEYAQHTITELVADKTRAQKQVDDILTKTKDRKKIAIACANIEHATMIYNILTAKAKQAVVVHSKQEDDECDESLSEFESNPNIRFMTFVTMVSIGYNYPPIDTIVLMRPTRRTQLYVQTVGRGLRPSPKTGKVDCLVLDYGRVVENCGPLNAPYVNRGGKKGLLEAMEQSPQLTVVCAECGAFNFPLRTEDSPQCIECKAFLQVVKERVDPTKNLEEKAAIIDLYASVKSKKIVRSVMYKALGLTQEMKHRRKLITLIFVDGSTCKFFVSNPEFAVIDDNIKYDQKKWLEKLEAKYEQLLRDIVGTHISLRSIYDVFLNAKNAVEVEIEQKNGFDKYKSHKIVKDFALEPAAEVGKQSMQDHVDAATAAFGTMSLRKAPNNKQDKLFLKRGF